MVAQKTAAVLVSLALLSGCISTQEMPLSENVWRIQTEAGGLLFVGQTSKQTLKRAAELTLKQGYSHFRLVDASMASGSEFVGYTPGMARTNVSVVGNTAYGTTTYSPGVPINRPTSQAGATVIMYRAGDPEAKDALDAESILREHS